MITQDQLRRTLDYDPETGVFTHVAPRKKCRVGARAGSGKRGGYRSIVIARRRYYEHQLAFLYMTGDFPRRMVDHINREKDDNRWGNLREATPGENALNAPLRATNTSGFRGVRKTRNGKRWMARGKLNGVCSHIGVFDSAEEAAAAAEQWRVSKFGEYATLNTPPHSLR